MHYIVFNVVIDGVMLLLVLLLVADDLEPW